MASIDGSSGYSIDGGGGKQTSIPPLTSCLGAKLRLILSEKGFYAAIY